MKRFLLSILFFAGVVSLGFGQTITTAQPGAWDNTSTWTGGVIPTNSNSSEIRLSHNVNIPNSYTAVVDQVVVDAGISLTVDAGGIIDLQNSGGTDLALNDDLGLGLGANLLVNGNFIFRSQSNIFYGDFNLSTISFNSGAEYNHAVNGGSIAIAAWDTNSTCRLTGVTNTVPSGFGQSFGTFEWANSAQSASITLSLTSATIQQDFILSSTGSSFIYLTGSAGTIDINRDFIVSGSARFFGSATANVTYDISGDFNYSSSNPSFSLIIVQTGTATFNVGGDFSLTSGALRSRALNTATVNLNFNGGSTQVYSISGGTLQNDYNYSIINGSTVNVGNSAFVNGGTFSISGNSTLITSNSAGIVTGTSNGSIRVGGTRTFNTGATIEYNGSANQALGDGFPSSGVNLTINNSGGVSNNFVTMSSDLTISSGRTLILTDGALSIGDGNLLTLNGTVTSTTNGGLAGTSLANLAIGGTGAFGTLGFVGTSELNNLTINRTSSGSVTLGGNLTIVGNTDPSDGFTQTAGDLLLNGNTLTLSGNYDQTGGTLISNSTSSLVVNGTGTLPASLSFSGDINTITLDRASATLNTGVSGFTATNLDLFSGTLDGSSISIADGGTLERRTSGVLANAVTALGSYNLIYDHTTALNTGAELPNSATALNNIEKRGTGVLTVQNNFTANGTLTFTNGSFNAGANTISLNGDLIANAASTLSNSTITFDGITNLTGSNNPTFGSITVNGTFNPAASLTVNGDITNNGTLNSSSGTLTINGTSSLLGSAPIVVNNFTIGASGVVTANSGAALQIDGNFANNNSFNANGGTVIFGGTTSISGTVPNFANIQVEGVFNAPSTLNLSGSLTNNGTFNDGDGIINMTGASAREIAGTDAFNIHTLNLDGSTVSNNNTGGVSIENGITLAANTTFDADGGGGSGLTTLLSTSSTDAAYVGQIPSTSSVTGNITVQRFFSTGRFWRYLGSPVTNSTVADWQDEFPITGTFSDPSTGSFDGTTLNSSSVSLYYYDAAGSAYVAYPSSGTAASNSIVNGRGYSPFIRNSTANVIGAVTGTLQQQAASLPVAFNGVPADSWNLVANPYAAPIDWDAVGWTKTNVADEVHVPKTDGSFATYIGGVAGNGGSQYIASGQAFWVRTNAGSPSLQTTEAVKSVGQSPTYQRTEPLELFRIKMMHADLSDEMVFALRDEATFGYDEKIDAARRLNINGFGYTISTTAQDGRKLKINSIPKVVDSDCSVTIPINMESVTKTGDFTLSFSEVSNLLNYYKVDFIDNYTNEVIAVSADFQYSYKINSEAASKAVDRFSLLLNNSRAGLLTNLKDVDACVNSEVSYPLENLNPNYSYSVFSGEVKIAEISKQTETAFLIPDSLLQNTVNVFDVYGQAGTCDSAKVGTFTVSTTDSNINLDVKVIGSSICPDASEGSFNLNTESGVDYFILDDSDTIQNIRGDGNLFTGVIESKYLNPGNNAFLIYAEKNECAYGSLNQQLEIDVTDLEIDQTIVFNSKSTCLNSPADINFVSQAGVDYEIYKGTTLVKSVTGEGTEETIQISESSLTTGLNEFTVLARYGSCAEFEFPETVQIQVEESINTDLNLLTKNTCGNTNVTVIIKNAQADKVYTLQSAGEDISSLTAATDGLLEFSLNADQVSIGVNELDIKIEGKACGAIFSANQAVFKVSEPINPDLNIEAADVCTGGQISIEIANPQIGKTYNLIGVEDIVATEVASSEDVLVFNFPSNEFGTGTHSLNVDIVDDVCGTVAANQTVEFEVFDAAIISTVENQNVCKNESVVIDLSSNVAMSSYQLYIGEELISEVSSSTVTLSPEETTTYTLTGVSENGCSVNTVNFSVEVTDLAKPGILVSNNVLESSIEGESYQWYLNSEKLVNEQGKVLVAQESGDYTVEVSKANCTEMSDVYTFSEEVLNANRALAESLHLYPNPVQDVLYLELENLDELEVKIYTISGRFMDQMNLNSDKNQSIDMSKFAEGTYLIQLTSGKGSITKRIIKK